MATTSGCSPLVRTAPIRTSSRPSSPMGCQARISGTWSAAAKTRVLDPWRCLAPSAVQKIGTYVALGQGDDRSVREWLSGDLQERMRLLNG